MTGEFKIWDSKKKIWMDDSKFFIGSDGKLFVIDHGGRIMSSLNKNIFPVFSTSKTDKNGIEVFIGDRMRNKYDYEFTIKHTIEDMGTCEKIDFKYGEIK